MKRHIVVALPSYTGTIHIGTSRSLMHDVIALMKRGDAVSVSDESCNAEIAVARAVMVSRFLASPGTHLIMVDHDVMWQSGGLAKLVDHNEDCVAGIYPLRKDPIAFPVRWDDDSKPGSMEQHPSKPLVGVGGAACGFMCCSRRMLEAMVKEFDYLKFKSVGDEVTWDLFDRLRDRDSLLRYSEDYSFCERWRAMGGKIWIDPDITLGHAGLKLFQGSFGSWEDRPQ